LASTDKYSFFPFEEFIDRLRENGFPVGVHTYLNVQTLVNQLDPNTSRETLRNLLAPLFVKNEREQIKFYRLFDSYFRLVDDWEKKVAGEVEEPLPVVREKKKRRQKGLKINRWLFMAGSILISILLTILLLWLVVSVRESAREGNIHVYLKKYHLDDDGRYLYHTFNFASNSLFGQPQICDDLDKISFAYDTTYLGDQGFMVQFHDSTIDPSVYRSWDFGNGLILADSMAPMILFPDTGVYEVSLTAINTYGCEVETRQLIYLQPPQTCFARFEAIITADNDLTVLFNDTSTIAPNDLIDTWRWSFGDKPGSISGDINPTYTYEKYQEYKVCLTIVTQSGCEDTHCKVIHLRDSRKANDLLTLAPRPPIDIGITSLKASRLEPWWPLIRFSIALLMLLLLISYELYKRNRKQLALSRETSKNGPYVWPIRFPHQTEVYPPEIFHKVATHLRQRQTSEIQVLDMDRTIESTLNSGGFPTFEYRFGSRPSEYLILIERSNFKDHQAQLYWNLATKLADQDIFIDIYFYQSDFRMYWKSLNERPIYLKELKVRHPNHRLIILGDGEHLLDPVYGDLNQDTFDFLDWKDRAVLTPVPPSEWGLQEVNLAKNFYVLPSTTASLSTLLNYFHGGEKQRIGNWVKNWPYHPPLPDFEDDYDFDLNELKVYLGPDVYQWVAACAVYPELHWDMTLHLGSVLDQYSFMQNSLVNEPNILKIIRIPWFRTGIIPEEIRGRLVDELSPELNQRVRTEIHKILQANQPPSDSYAAEKHERRMTIQNWQLQPLSWLEKIKVGEKIEDMMDREEINDVTVIKYLKNQDHQRRTIPVPDSWKEAIYRKGMPVLGVQPWVRWMTILPIILILLWPTINFIRKGHLTSPQDFKELVRKPDNFVEIDDVYYKLNEARDSALYFAYQGNILFKQADYGSAYNKYTGAIQLNPFQPDFYYQRGLSNYQLTRGAKTDSLLFETYQDFIRSLTLRPLFNSGTTYRRDTVMNLPIALGDLSYDGEKILVNEGNTVQLYAKDSLRLIRTFYLEGQPQTIHFSKDGKYILSAVGNNGQIHDTETGNRIAYLDQEHQYPITSIRLSPKGEYIITGAEDNLAIIWSFDKARSRAERIHYLEHIHSGAILDVAFSPDNRYVATASADSTAAIWNKSTGQLEGYLVKHGSPVDFVEFSPDGRNLMTASKNGKIAIWNLSGKQLLEKQILGEYLKKASFVADGSLLMTVGERSDHSSTMISFYGFNNEAPIVRIRTTEFQVRDDQLSFASMSGDGSYLFLGVQDVGIMTYQFNPKTFAQNPLRQFSHFNASMIHYEREQFGDAISDFSKLISQDTSHLDAFYGRGLSYLYQSQFESDNLDTISFKLGVKDLKYIMGRDEDYFDSIPSLLPFFFQFYSEYQGLKRYADDFCMLTQKIDSGYCEFFRYEQILPYSEGLAAVQGKGLWGYIDSSRTLVIPLNYEEAYPFKNGLAQVRLAGENSMSLINMDNQIAYIDVQTPSEGLQAVRSPESRLYGYIDVESGEEVIEPAYYSADKFIRGYAQVSRRVLKTLEYGLIDQSGSADTYNGFIYADIRGNFKDNNEVVATLLSGETIPLIYQSPESDLSMIPRTRDDAPLVKNDFPEQDLPYKIIGRLSNGLFRAQQGGKYGFVAPVKQMNPYVQQAQSSKVEAGLRTAEEKYVVIIPFQYTEAYDFSYERAAVKNVDGLWGFIDTYGKVIIPHQFQKVEYFIKRDDNVLALVEENKQTYYIDRTGKCVSYNDLVCPAPEMRTSYKQVIRTEYRDQETSMTVFEENGKWGVKEQSGEIIIKPKYDNQINFSGNLARVNQNGKWGFIDNTGKTVVELKYDGALDFSDGLAAVQRGGRWGYIDPSGKVQIDFLFSMPGKFQNGWAIIKEGKISFKIDKKGRKIGARRR
jgi:WD40 repeat protein